MRRLYQLAQTLDTQLLAVRARTRRLVLALTILTMIGVGLPSVPREYVDYSRMPGLNDVRQERLYGPDTVADMYEAKVVLNDVRDMYTKREYNQTAREAQLWSKEASAPYPPVTLLAVAGLYKLGEVTGVGYYGMVLSLACLFVALSLFYFLRTRWYVFPILYLNFSYFARRMVYVQDGTYLIMLVITLIALLLVSHRREAAHLLMATSIVVKLSPLYYAKNVFAMRPWVAGAFVAILTAGLLLPFFVFDNYSYIYRFNDELRGSHWYNLLGPLLWVIPFATVLSYVETRLPFDMEDRIGWSLVPFAMLLSMKMNAARHLLIVLLVPDKRGIRNIVAALGLALYALLPSVIRLGSVVYIASGLLAVGLAGYLYRIGWQTIRDDLRHPAATARLMLAMR